MMTANSKHKTPNMQTIVHKGVVNCKTIKEFGIVLAIKISSSCVYIVSPLLYSPSNMFQLLLHTLSAPYYSNTRVSLRDTISNTPASAREQTNPVTVNTSLNPSKNLGDEKSSMMANTRFSVFRT